MVAGGHHDAGQNQVDELVVLLHQLIQSAEMQLSATRKLLQRRTRAARASASFSATNSASGPVADIVPRYLLADRTLW